jgi:SOS response regulatory protein OraA/RecX
MDEPSARAISVGLKALARRELSEAELQHRIERKGIPPAEASCAVRHLQAVGHQSDERAAEERSRLLAQRGFGDAAIVADLEQRSLTRRVIDEALATLPPERARAEALRERIGRGPRLAQTLRRRGFSAETLDAVASAIAYGN